MASIVWSEALNLGVHRDLTRSEKERDQRRGHENGGGRERKRPTKRERQELAAAQRLKKAREESEDIKADSLPHTKTTITQNGDSSMVLSMEMNGVVYQGVLFAQPKTARV
ncbi:AT-rich interactive domain-containing protein 3A [Amphibalanus amphitrite]|uniref:AT-rich interactive domain-containing protein 3A n=1 Tax=Amphibalanus amphitrite TaxID=1232801 RepID=A0A6A4X744_AMPAM|nr:AT-rich interactive domain-containing protein 3A [Amphibalanus amphitrite]